MLKRLCNDEPEVLRMLREATTGERGNPTGANQHSEDSGGNSDNITVSNNDARGTRKDYTLDRLARNHPNLYAAVVDGEMSANAAGPPGAPQRQTGTLGDAERRTATPIDTRAP